MDTTPPPPDPTTTPDPDPSSPPPPPPPPDSNPPPAETFYVPIYVLTAVFGIIFIFGPMFVRKGENRGVFRSSIMLAAFSMWLFWVTVYIAQMNPLMGPRLPNTTLAWMTYAWGSPKEER